MKIICSINGMDGTGKTTQINKLSEEYPDYIDVVGDLGIYDAFPKLSGEELHKWWFEDSTQEQFCDAIYASISSRNQEILNSKKRIVIVDKGIINFDARVQATLKIRGVSNGKIQELITNCKRKYNIKEIEMLKIAIVSENFNSSKVNDSQYNKNEKEKYLLYQKEQNDIILQNIADGNYDVILKFSDGIEYIYSEIKELVLRKYIKISNSNGVKISISEKLEFIGNGMRYIDVETIKYTKNIRDNFKAIHEILDFIENEKLNNIQIYNYNTNNLKKENEMFNKLNNYKRDMLPRFSTENMHVKEIEQFEISNSYKEILKELYLKVIEKCISINLFLIHGSAGRECMHVGWSDLDIIIVLEKYDFNTIRQIGEIVNSYDIKIGTTIYSKYEMESLLVDAKTLYSIYIMQKGKIRPTAYQNIKIPEIKYDDLLMKNLQVLPEAIHKLKRLLYEKGCDEKAIVKNLNLVMKVILINDGIFPNSYEEVFEMFASKYGLEAFNIEKLINNKDRTGIKEYAIYIIENVVNI